jgi:hypothetical protein
MHGETSRKFLPEEISGYVKNTRIENIFLVKNLLPDMAAC